MSGDLQSDAEFRLAVNRVYRWYAAGFIAFVLVLALLVVVAEQLPNTYVK